MNGVADFALADRGDGGACSRDRIPTGRYPVWSTSLLATANAAGDARFEFRPERDTLLTNMSIDTGNVSVDPVAGVAPTIDATYCNTRLLHTSLAKGWQSCCNRKPVFLQGVRESKTLEFVVHNITPDIDVVITLSGFQGNGCCG